MTSGIIFPRRLWKPIHGNLGSGRPVSIHILGSLVRRFPVLRLTVVIFLVLISLVLFISVIPRHMCSGHTFNDEEIPKDHYFRTWTNTREGDVITYSIEVIDGSRVDLYFLNESQSGRYVNGDSFVPDMEVIGITSTDGTFRIPDDQDYLFIVDNMDNEQENDTTPEGEVIVDIEVLSSIIDDGSNDPVLFRLVIIPLVILILGFAAIKGDAIRLRRIRKKRRQEARSIMVSPPFIRHGQSAGRTAEVQSPLQSPQKHPQSLRIQSIEEKRARGAIAQYGADDPKKEQWTREKE